MKWEKCNNIVSGEKINIVCIYQKKSPSDKFIAKKIQTKLLKLNLEQEVISICVSLYQVKSKRSFSHSLKTRVKSHFDIDKKNQNREIKHLLLLSILRTRHGNFLKTNGPCFYSSKFVVNFLLSNSDVRGLVLNPLLSF